jgi:predicted nucleic acid-binding Zn ribbon protein
MSRSSVRRKPANPPCFKATAKATACGHGTDTVRWVTDRRRVRCPVCRAILRLPFSEQPGGSRTR